MGKNRPPAKDPIPALEWATAAAGLLVALALLAILVVEVTKGHRDDLPLLSARIEKITATPVGHTVSVVVSNRASQTAAAVQIEGTLGEEQASATIGYVPGHSDARGGLLFDADPRTGELQLRVVGYEVP